MIFQITLFDFVYINNH